MSPIGKEYLSFVIERLCELCISCFQQAHSTLGSVLPLAMFLFRNHLKLNSLSKKFKSQFWEKYICEYDFG